MEKSRPSIRRCQVPASLKRRPSFLAPSTSILLMPHSPYRTSHIRIYYLPIAQPSFFFLPFPLAPSPDLPFLSKIALNRLSSRCAKFTHRWRSLGSGFTAAKLNGLPSPPLYQPNNLLTQSPFLLGVIRVLWLPIIRSWERQPRGNLLDGLGHRVENLLRPALSWLNFK